MEKTKYDPSVREELDNLSAQEWENVYLRVLKYARKIAAKFALLGTANIDPDGLVNEAVARAYGVGTNNTFRNWNREKYPKLEHFLCSVVDSMTSHTADRVNKFPRENLFHEDGSIKPMPARPDSGGFSDSFTSNNPEKAMIDEEALQVLIDQLKSIANGDEDAEMVVCCLELDISSRKEMAEEAGIDIEKVYQVMEKLRKGLKKIQSESEVGLKEVK